MEQMKDYLEVRSEKMNGEILREKIKNEESKNISTKGDFDRTAKVAGK